MRNLNKLYYLKLEIEELKEEINNLSIIGSPALSDMPHGNMVGNPTEQYLIKKQKLIEKLNKILETYVDELTEVEEIVCNIEKPDVRTIARLRYIDNLKWEEIANKVYLDRCVCSRKLKEYFKKENEKRKL